MAEIVVVSFFTPKNIYQKMAERLIESCNKFNLPYDIRQVEDRGSWVKNCNYKASFIMDCISKHDKKVVWVDADGRFGRYPELLDKTTASFGVRAEPGGPTRKQVDRDPISLPSNWPKNLGNIWFNSGTILFEPCESIRRMVTRWIELGQEYPTNWDQWNLQQAWADIQPDTEWFPREYCQIDKLHGNRNAVILHDLASVMQKVNRKE